MGYALPDLFSLGQRLPCRDLPAPFLQVDGSSHSMPPHWRRAVLLSGCRTKGKRPHIAYRQDIAVAEPVILIMNGSARRSKLIRSWHRLCLAWLLHRENEEIDRH